LSTCEIRGVDGINIYRYKISNRRQEINKNNREIIPRNNRTFENYRTSTPVTPSHSRQNTAKPGINELRRKETRQKISEVMAEETDAILVNSIEAATNAEFETMWN